MRFFLLYCIFIFYKIRYINKVKFNGFTIYFSFANSKITIDKGGVVNSGSLTNLLGLYQRSIIIARNGGQIKIGKNVGISGSTIYSMLNISIGDDCLIGANCKIIDNDFHPIEFKKRKQNKVDDIVKKSILIGNNCFIGMNSIILKGTTIGNNSVVGAGSVVCGIFPDNVIIAGNPARIVKIIV